MTVAVQRGCCRLTTGLQVLELWATTARQIERNQVYDALFAVADGSVFWRYSVLRDASEPKEFFILVRDDLIVKIDSLWPDVFGIRYIGSREEANGLDVAVNLT